LERKFKSKGNKIHKKDGITITGPAFWINARPSNTEPLVRVQLAAKEKEVFLEKKKELDIFIK